MKTMTILAAGALSALALLAPLAASAGLSEGLGVWEGTGTTRAAGADGSAPFQVSVTRRSSGARKVRVDGKVTLGNGQVMAFWQELEEGNAGDFRVVSSHGLGAGRCFANGICQSYEERKDRHAVATTIVRDAPNKVRVLITEFDKGQPVRFTQESLTKRP